MMFPHVTRETKDGLPITPSTAVEPVSHHVILEGAPNALATCRDASQAVVAGRNVFKIYTIEPTKFVEKLNLRMGKNVDLSYSSADVVWNPVDDALLATAATNGSVVTWNLNSNLKQDQKYQDHRRTVNKVCFHPSEPQFLLSGSQDGTMKLFDLRAREATSTFYSLSESVRDVQFCPHQYFSFAAVQENGYVQMWDLRRTDRFERQFAAHSGPVFTCDWHPVEKSIFATAGRDKSIKIWDISEKEVLQHCIQTIASVSRVKWQPNKKYHIASSSLVVDYTVNVWDIRRPYVPFASFGNHKDVASGFAWRNPYIVLTTSKDCTLYQHVFADANRPAERANQMGLDINPCGDMLYAYNKKFVKETVTPNFKLPSSSSTSFTVPRMPVLNKKSTNVQQRYKPPLSELTILKNGHELISMDWFIESANKYMLHGKPLPDLCEHNAVIATKLQRHHVAQTWHILKLLYTSGSMLLSEYSHIASQDKLTEDKLLDSSQDGSSKISLLNGSSYHNLPSSKSGSRHVSGGSYVGTDRGLDNGLMDEDSDSGNTEHENTITYFASELAQGDFFFADGKTELFHMMDFSQLSTLPADEDWTLPREAFSVRHVLGDGSPPPEIANMPSSPLCTAEEISECDYVNNEDEGESIMLALFSAPKFPPWNCTQIVIDMLKFYAEQGDVQMSVSVLIVLGERIRYAIDENLQEHWFHSYLDLLSRFELWNISNEVIALSCLPAINNLNQQSTTVYTVCGKCNKNMTSVSYFCDGCKSISVCCICHQIVRGVFVWCQGCAHGGHLLHLQEWFEENRLCPAGCGHLCEYT